LSTASKNVIAILYVEANHTARANPSDLPQFLLPEAQAVTSQAGSLNSSEFATLKLETQVKEFVFLRLCFRLQWHDGPIKATKRSFEILEKTWGKALTANFGIGLIVFVASLVGIIPIILGAFVIGAGYLWAGIAVILLGVVVLLIILLISSALNSIIIGALYLYAAEGSISQQFDDDLFRHAFAHR